MAKETAEQGKEQGRQQARGGELRRATPRGMSPFEGMDRLMERMMQGFLTPGLSRAMWGFPDVAGLEANAPRVDVIDRDEQVIVRAELPGVHKENVDVSVRDDSVTIKATSEHEEEQEEGEYYRHELVSGSFSRTIPLPTEVDGTKAKANFKDGILELTLPKVERAKSQRVPIE